MRFCIASFVTLSTFLSAALADHAPSGDDHVVYVTKKVQVYVTKCTTTTTTTSSCSGSSVVSVSSGSSSASGSQSSLSSGTVVSISSSQSLSGSSSASVSSSVSSGNGTVTTQSSLSRSLSYSHSVSSGSSGSSSQTSVSSGSSSSSSSSITSSASSSSSQSSSTSQSVTSSSSSGSTTSSASSSSQTSSSVSSTSSSVSSTSSSVSSSSASSSSSSVSSSSVSSSSSSVSSTSSSVSSSSSSVSSSSVSSTSSSVSSTSSSVSSTSSSVSSTSSSASSTSSSASSTSSSVSSTSSSSSSSSSSTSVTSSSSSSSTSQSSTSSTSSSSTSSTSPTSTCAYWYEDLKHQGLAPFNTGADASTYQVFRNVSAYGAKGDGIHDDTEAINLAISSGGRCAPGAPGSGSCNSTTTTPAVVYFPPGTYLVSTPIIDYYYTQLIGNPNCMPVIKANSNFTGSWVIDGDEYFGYNGGGVLGYGATNVFWRQIRNFIIDMTIVPSSLGLAGIHWPTGQATSIQNVVVKMSEVSGTQHYGLGIESGSGGFMTDLTFYGGKWGIWVGNQQFTMRNLTFYNSVTAIYQLWDWGWTYKGVSINNCSIGLDMSNVDADGVTQAVGSVTFIDSSISDTPIGIKTIHTSTSAPPAGGSLILENVSLDNVATAIEGPTGAILVGTSGTATINYGQGHEYTPSGPATVSGTITPNARPTSLTAGTDFYERSKPQYENIPASQFVSVRDAGAMGDGVTDDSNVLNAVLAAAAVSGKIVFFDAGDYLVTKTISVPAGVKIVGEAYPVILSSGAFFEDMTNPLPVVQVGLRGDTGSIEWSDMIISTQGAQAGAILIEYNLAAPTTTPAGIWDVHTRIGGFAGSHLQVGDCPKTPDITITPANFPTQCIGAFMSMHITTLATGLYMENNWLWVADHDVEDQELTQISIYAGRGLLIESTVGGIWLYGTAVEHHSLYQYHISGASNLYMGQIQTETAYYQPNPDATEPFPQDPNYNDPTFTPGQSGWGLLIDDSYDILVYGAGLYSFFDNYNVTCSNQGAGETCQAGIFSIDTVSTVSVYNLNTVGTNDMITRGGTNIALYADNNDGFIGTIALYKNN